MPAAAVEDVLGASGIDAAFAGVDRDERTALLNAVAEISWFLFAHAVRVEHFVERACGSHREFFGPVAMALVGSWMSPEVLGSASRLDHKQASAAASRG